MNRLPPLITYVSPSRFAVVRKPAGSEPASGSVSAKDAIVSPAARDGRNSCFCASVPNFTIIWPAIELFVPNIDRNAGVV